MLDKYYYKTKIRFQNLECPLESVLPCGIDIGYSSIKVESPYNASIIPSLVRKVKDDNVFRYDKDDIRYISDKGAVWYVGSLAKKTLLKGSTSVKQSTMLGRQRVQSEEFLIQIQVALFFSRLKALTDTGYELDENPMQIQTGLPPEFFTQDTGSLIKRFSGSHSFGMKIGKRPWITVNFEIAESQVHVCKQPFGTLMSCVIDNKGKMINEHLLKKDILIVDGGFHTIDTFHLIQGAIEGDSITWENFAMQEVYQRTCQDILKQTKNNADISVYNLEKLLDQGVVHYGARKESYDFSTDFYKNLKGVCLDFVNELMAAYNSMANVDIIVLTGGTGLAWETIFKEQFAGMGGLEIIVAGNGKSAARANVQGYYNLLMTGLLPNGRR